MTWCIKWLALPLAMVLMFGGWLSAGVLEQVPANAWVVVKVKNLKDFSTKVGNLAQQTGLAQMQPMAADPLGSLQQIGNIQNGLKADGEMAVVMIPPAAGGQGEPDTLILIPVSDYKAFGGNFPDAKEEEGMMVFSMPNDPEKQVYMAQWGEYAAMTPTKELLAAKPQGGIKLTGMSAKEVDGKDLVAWANLPAMRAKAMPALKQGREKMMAGLDKEMAKASPDKKKFVPLAKAAGNLLFNGMERLMSDATAMTLGLDIAPEGLKPTMMLDFAADSYSAQQLGKLANGTGTMTNGLPEGKYMMFGGSSQINGEVVAAMLQENLAPVMSEINALGDEAKPMNQYITTLMSTLKAVKSQSFGVFTPEGALANEGMLKSVSLMRGQAKVMAENQKTLMSTQEELMGLFTPRDATKPTQLTITPAAKTVAGVSFDQFHTEVNLDAASQPAGPAQPGRRPRRPRPNPASMMMKILYGDNGINVYGGVVDDSHYLAVSGLSDEQITQAVEAAKSDKDVLGNRPLVQQSNKQLPTQRLMVVYVAMDQVVNTASAVARQNKLPVNVTMPETLPPLAGSISNEQGALRGDGFVPVQVLQEMVSAAMQAMMGGMQGNPGGNPPQAAPGGNPPRGDGM